MEKPRYLSAGSLADHLRRCRVAYYNHDPIVSDATFDALEDSLRELDPDHPYFSEIGAPVDGDWPKAKHRMPMGSLEKVNTAEELRSWWDACGIDKLKRSAHAGAMLMDKLDGAGLELVYRCGMLVRAITRGDGVIGDDITRNVRLMKGVPWTVAGSFTGSVRGEVMCLRADFEKHFKGLDYSNARNTANGIMKRQDDPEPCRHLTVICYEVVGVSLASKLFELEWLEQHGFRVPNRWLCSTADEAVKVYNQYLERVRDTLDYDIDGLVVQVEDTQLFLELGDHKMKPKGARAFKFPHEQKLTTLRRVDWQVGASGRITPVAFFDAIELSGVQVKQASLHNPGYIERLVAHRASKLRVGDVVLVSRRNDVIPYVEELVTSGAGDTIDPPTKCPSCRQTTYRLGEYLVCTNPLCPAQMSGAIKRWVSKLDVKDFGEALVDALCSSGMVRTVADLYTLDEERVSRLRMASGRIVGTATARLALRNLKAKTELPLEVLVGSLGIPMWGRSMVKLLVEAGCDDLDSIRSVEAGDVSCIPGIGEAKAWAFFNGINACHDVIQQLLANGVTVAKPASGHLKGTTMCMTGFRDGALASAFEAAGGSVKGSVSRGLTYLVAADPNASSGKLDKARQQGTRVLGRDEMWKIVKGSGATHQ